MVAVLKAEDNDSKTDIVTGFIIMPSSHWEHTVFHWCGAILHRLCFCTAVDLKSRRTWDRAGFINAGSSQDSRKTSF